MRTLDSDTVYVSESRVPPCSTLFQRNPGESDTIQVLRRKRQKTMVDGGEEICNFCYDGRPRHDVTTTPEHTTSRRGEDNRERIRPSKVSKGELLKFLSLNRFSPIELIFSSNVWLQSKFHFLSMSDRIVDKTIERYRLSCFVMNMKELVSLYKQKDVNFFHSCIGNDKQKYYYNVDESYEILETFIKTQIAYNKITIFDFVHFLYTLLNKTSGKRNCMYIEGRSNSGKTWFSNILQEFMLNAGFISNWNRYHQFPLQDCLHRNLLIFDEPNIEPSSFETWKNILAGNNQAINVKYRTN